MMRLNKKMNWRFLALVLPMLGLFLFAPAYGASQDTKLVSKKAFAKELALYLKLPPGKKEKCYTDLKKSDAHTPFICALKKAKVFSSKKKKFSPQKKLTWKFALTSLCRGEKWAKKKSWKNCSSYARTHGLIEANVDPKKKMTRGELTLLLEQTEHLSAAAPEQPEIPPSPPPSSPPPAEIPPLPETSLTFTPYPEDSIGVNFFSNIILAAPMPNRFYKNEVYFMEGDIVNSTADEIFVFICRENQGCDNSINFIEKTNGRHFRIPVFFQETGNFQIGLIPGRSGQSRVEDISVLPTYSSPLTEGTAPNTLSIGYQQGKTIFHWDGEGTLTRLVIFQNAKRTDYLFRQRPTSFSPPSKDFEGFVKGQAGWRIEHDQAVSEMQMINLTVQDFRKIEEDEIEIISLPEILPTPGRFTFKGNAKTAISKKAAITLPDGKVEEIALGGEDLPEGSNITIERDFSEFGTYIFEINSPQGSAIVNVPVYVGTSIPLIPDYFASHETELAPLPSLDLGKSRIKLLELINVDRAAHGLAAVTLADDLNSVAQSHSHNMVNLNFFGHVDPAGNSPDDRRKKAGIVTPIRENLGKASNLEFVEAGLMRSPVHRAAILDPDMKRVGLGIVKDAEGYYFVTQNFAENPLRLADLPGLEDELYAAVNGKRSSLGLSSLAHSATLRNAARNWSSRMAQENFFAITSPSGQKLIDFLRDQGITTSIQSHILEVSQKNQLSEEIVSQSGLKVANHQNIGIGLGLNSTGEIFATVIYTP
jgi:uncharacterized protein YkwD